MTDLRNETLPGKTYFRIGEVARYVGVESHVIRYWEGEFDEVEPTKGKGGQRLFRRDDVLLLRRIRKLLYDDGYTIEGARRVVGETRKDDAARNDILGKLKKLANRLQKYRSVGA